MDITEETKNEQKKVQFENIPEEHSNNTSEHGSSNEDDEDEEEELESLQTLSIFNKLVQSHENICKIFLKILEKNSESD
jgi:hypothetical protein